METLACFYETYATEYFPYSQCSIFYEDNFGGQFWLSKWISSVFRLLKIMLTLDTDNQNSNTLSFLT